MFRKLAPGDPALRRASSGVARMPDPRGPEGR